MLEQYHIIFGSQTRHTVTTTCILSKNICITLCEFIKLLVA